MNIRDKFISRIIRKPSDYAFDEIIASVGGGGSIAPPAALIDDTVSGEEVMDDLESSGEQKKTKKSKNIYDGAALGQYLFGQDPLHTGGHKITGYRNPDFDFNFDNCHFDLRADSQGKLNDLYLITSRDTFRVANLHLHSKTLIDIPSRAIEEWNEILMSANSGIQLFSDELIEDRIHSLKISPMSKVRRARKVGYGQYLKRVIRNRMGRFLK